MFYNATIYNEAADLGSDHKGVTFENVTIEGVIEIMKFALEYGKSVSAIVFDMDACGKDGACDV